MDYWKSLEHLVQTQKLVIDRPKGSGHPQFPESIYPLDYGYLEGTISGDGQGIDVWHGSLGDKTVQAVFSVIDSRTRILETKLIVGCTDDDIETIMKYHNSYSQSAIMVKRKSEKDEI